MRMKGPWSMQEAQIKLCSHQRFKSSSVTDCSKATVDSNNDCSLSLAKTIKSTQIWENQAHRLETVVLLAWDKFDHITNRTSSNIWKLGSKSLRSLMIHMQAALHWPPSGSANWSKQTWEPLQPAAVRIDPRSTIECSPRSTACHPPWVRPTLFHPWCTTPLPALQRADGHWLVVRRSQDPCRRCSRARRCHQS